MDPATSGYIAAAIGGGVAFWFFSKSSIIVPDSAAAKTAAGVMKNIDGSKSLKKEAPMVPYMGAGGTSLYLADRAFQDIWAAAHGNYSQGVADIDYISQAPGIGVYVKSAEEWAEAMRSMPVDNPSFVAALGPAGGVIAGAASIFQKIFGKATPKRQPTDKDIQVSHQVLWATYMKQLDAGGFTFDLQFLVDEGGVSLYYDPAVYGPYFTAAVKNNAIIAMANYAKTATWKNADGSWMTEQDTYHAAEKVIGDATKQFVNANGDKAKRGFIAEQKLETAVKHEAERIGLQGVGKDLLAWIYRTRVSKYGNDMTKVDADFDRILNNMKNNPSLIAGEEAQWKKAMGIS